MARVAYDPKKLVETSSPVEVQMPLFRQTRDKMKVAKRKLVIKSKAAQKEKFAWKMLEIIRNKREKVMDLYRNKNYKRRLLGKSIW